MKLDFNIQDESISLAKIIDTEMAKKPKKVYMFIGVMKEAGFNIIEESIIDSKAKISMYMGIDKRNTTKNLLTNILRYTRDVHVYNNNDLKEFESNIYIFENDKLASIYVSSSNASEGGLTTNLSIFTKFVYNLEIEEEKKAYKENIKSITLVKDINFKKLDKNLIDELLRDKIIFSTKQYEHNVKSISEFLGKEEVKKTAKDKEQIEDIQAVNFNIPTIDLSLSDIDIDVSSVDDISEETKKEIKVQEKEKKVKAKQREEAKKNEIEETEDEEKYDGSFGDIVDIGSLLLTKSKVKLSEVKEESTIKDEEENEKEDSIIFKKLDLNNISNYMFELPAKQQNGVDLDVIKIPNYIRELIPNFFGFPEKAKSKVINGNSYKSRDIQVDIVDVKNNKKIVDKSSSMIQKKGQTYFCIMSKYLENIDYEENDIIRIIKLSDDIYHLEIVSKDLQEYKIWSKIMNKKLKGSNRKYGIM